MANGVSATLDSSVLKLLVGFTSGVFVAPTVIAASLNSAAFGTGKATSTEWTSGGAANTNYTSRLTIGVDTGNWSIAAFVAGTGCVATNSAQVAFTALTGTGNNVLAVGFHTSATIGSGAMLFFSDVTSQAVAAGIIVQFNIGDIQLTLL